MCPCNEMGNPLVIHVCVFALNSPQESSFCTSRRFNGLPATVSKSGKCFLFVGKGAAWREKSVANGLTSTGGWRFSPMLRSPLLGIMNEIVKCVWKNVLEKKRESDYVVFMLIAYTLLPRTSTDREIQRSPRSQSVAFDISIWPMKRISPKSNTGIIDKLVTPATRRRQEKVFNKIRRRRVRQNKTASSHMFRVMFSWRIFCAQLSRHVRLFRQTLMR